LDTEDAAAQYADHTGRPHLLPTNRVAIYSPRFGYVRTTMGLETGVMVNHLASALDLTRGSGMKARVAIARHAQLLPSQSVRMRSRASGVESEQQQVGMHQRAALTENIDMT